MASHLNQQQLAILWDALEERYQELREEIRTELLKQDGELYADLAGQVHDAEEESVADLLVDLNYASLDRHVRELNGIEEALMRMRTGSYGYCVDTGDPIPYERLRVNPAAKRTIEAQELFERQYQERRPSL
ncbi:hypothetical protein CAI21_05575 [Alkalilimnicola ehrlichii]|uniref:Zinc finger DksA/TraR C4-type domain-containing protein n=1 Tax=Alkalilimnicola ehrlichii TaxID=351052 RepID=A0A3E0X196_9GAMM|nr:TraR/DksA family transcriptional regulator [Alkalilimnicola ehrlichii]RFA30517.1 hypothetical protein CAI21_05575 [Alkalilimnicola ehrlichii]RFA38066.1 hypothetical protein CAL65_06945 [Alkalilimnicola ehrlichii]